MPAGPAPGVLYMGGLQTQDREIFRPILEGLVKAGYNRFIEPCAGAFGFSHVAVQAGWKPSQIESSDVTMFSSVLGAAIMGNRVDDLSIKANGFEDEDMGDPATVLYVQALLNAKVKSLSNPYWQAASKQMEIDRDKHLESLGSQLTKLHERFDGMKYQPMDLFDHFQSAADDPNAVVALMPPWGRGDFEKFLDPSNSFKWNVPSYTMFDPMKGFERLYEMFSEVKCLVLMAVDSEFWEGYPLPFAVYGGHRRAKEDKGAIRSANLLFLSNRNDEVLKHLGGSPMAVPSKASVLEPPPYPFLPADHPITQESSINVMLISPKMAMYCRQLWTHRFTGAPTIFNLGVFIDGYLAGVCGLTTGTRGSVTGDAATYVQYMYGMPVQHRKDFRLPLLLHFLTLSRNVISMCFPDYSAAIARKVISVDMSGYKYSKGYRARIVVNGTDLRPMISQRKKDPYGGWATHHQYPIVDADIRDIFLAWLERDLKWQKDSLKQKNIREKKETQTTS